VGGGREALGPVAVDRARRADAVGAEKRGEARDRRREAVRRERGGTEEGELSASRRIRMRGEGEAGDGGAGRPRLELETDEGQERLDVAARRGQRDRARVESIGIESERGLQARARESLRLEAADETFEGGVREKEKRLERGERPLELHALGEAGPRDARLRGPRGEGAGGGGERAGGLAEAARDLAFGKIREIADRAKAPAVERLGDLEGGAEAREGQRREEGRLLALGDDGRRVGKSRGDARGELGGCDADARGKERLLGGESDRAGERERAAVGFSRLSPLTLTLSP